MNSLSVLTGCWELAFLITVCSAMSRDQHLAENKESVGLGERECCGNTSHRRVFPQPFRDLPNLDECFYNSIETRRKYFLFLLENSPRKITGNEENLIVLLSSKRRFSTSRNLDVITWSTNEEIQNIFRVSIELSPCKAWLSQRSINFIDPY